MKMNKIIVSLFAAGVMTSPLAHATNGYFRIGVGDKAESMGGVGIALPQDAMAAATNPAGMAMAGDHTDFGLTWFKPNRTAEIAGNVLGAGAPPPSMDGTYDGNGKSNFFIPDFGYNKMISSKTAVGISVFGAGGMNTQYDTSPLANLGGGAKSTRPIPWACRWSRSIRCSRQLVYSHLITLHTPATLAQ
jgi:long-chain fatty acid transport protein